MSMHLNSDETPDWFHVSLSSALHTLAQHAHTAVPSDIRALIDETAGRVYFHESCINDMQTFGLSTDPSFIYSGYRSAMDNLLAVVARPGSEGTPRGRICRDINSYLNNILVVIKEKGSNVTHLFTDPDMCNLLVGLARLF
ncbi:hypothetical protein ACGC1H_000017 [Rhizoctonia solani]